MKDAATNGVPTFQPLPPGTPEREATAAGTFSERSGTSKREQGLRLTFAELTSLEVTPVRWLVEGLVPAESFVLAASEPNIGKTWFALYAAGEVARNGGSVLFLELEGSVGSFKRRLEAVGLSGEHNCHAVMSSGLDLSDDRSVKALEADVRRVIPELIVVDPFAEAFSGDENSSSDVNRALKSLKRLQDLVSPKATLLLLHHTSKPTKDGRNEIHNIRGSSAFGGSADVALKLWSGPKRTGELIVNIQVVKARDTERGGPKQLAVRFGHPEPFLLGETAGELRAVGDGLEVLSAEEAKTAMIAAVVAAMPQPTKADLAKRLVWNRAKADLALELAMTAGHVVRRGARGGYASVDGIAKALEVTP
jgi:hypothetical protein